MRNHAAGGERKLTNLYYYYIVSFEKLTIKGCANRSILIQIYQTMNDIVRKRLHKFHDEHWPILVPKTLKDSKIIEFNRIVWYCNISGNPIPDLQKFNKSGIRLEYPTGNEVLSMEFYHRGDKTYRIYPCGHAFLDIHLLCAVFDSCVYSSNKNKAFEAFKDMDSKCPMCSNDDSCAGNTKNIYGVSGQYVGGTVHVKTTIPEDMLPHLKSVYTEGDVVDTGGYRGLDLYILENDEFKKVETEEYYPIWTLDRAKKYGYRRLLNGLLWNGEAQFDLIELDHGLIITPYDEISYQDEQIKTEKEGLKKVIFDEDMATISFEKSMRMIRKVGKFYRIDKPFESADEFKFYLGLGLPLQIKVSGYDYLTIDPEEEYEYDKGDIRTRQIIYFTDLNGENRLDLSFW
jgi:hypothetical protein